MTSREVRSSFLKYFEKNGHVIVPSSSLVPHDDPTLLFTNAGMNQFKDVFLGKEKRDYTRATTVQKVMRVSGKHNDLDNVGPSHRHHTFFEMLGNFSFGDYFKKEAIPLAWTLLTEVWKLDPERLHPTIFTGDNGIPRDDEAFEIWTQFVPAARITALGAAENFWQMGETGPCGRCTEIMFYRPEAPCAEPVCRGMECSCDRYFEIWNIVFMEFNRVESGELQPLPALSVDTGMGFERVTSVLQNKFSNYDTDIFTPLLDAIGAAAGRKYSHFHGGGDHPDVSMRVIADHLRAMTFLIADGVVPSNEWRGYVLRKIMRRAMRHGKKLGFVEPFLHGLADVVVEEMGDAYPELRRNRDTVVQVVRSEEERFDVVLTAGLPRLEAALDRAVKAGSTSLPGDEAFRLYDSLGVPLDFMEDIAGQRGLSIDREGYERAMKGQRDRGRADSSFDTKQTQEFAFTSDKGRAAAMAPGDQFEGYTRTSVNGIPVVAVFDADRKQTVELRDGQSGFVVLERTPFYLESGGQVSDSGVIANDASGASAKVTGLVRLGPNGPRAHRVHVTGGSFKARDIVTAAVDEAVRDSTRRNHTATHLLHAALRQVLGPHVKQAGSLVAPDRLRFDFQHFAAIPREDLDRVERIVNEQICRNTPVQTEVRSTQDAMASGAMALFGEKYGDRVRVVSVPGFSLELCGGTHVTATGDIGFFVVTQEGGVAAGVRRIEALTGAGAVAWYQQQRAALDRVVGALNTTPEQSVEIVQRLQADAKRLAREVDALKMKAALGGGRGADGGAQDDTREVKGVKVIARRVSGLEKAALRGLSDSLRDRLGSGVVVIASENDGKVALVVSVTKDLTSRIQAGRIVKEIAPIVGGGGGGRPDFAEAGGKDPSKIDELISKAPDLIATLL
jgi:alanyl-tRNA synthetase